MMRGYLSLGVVLPLVAVAACGGYGSSTPTGPSPQPPAGAIVITVVGERGEMSFSPNPAGVPAGQMVSWHNVDTEVHRVVFPAGDTGNLAPGEYSAPMPLAAAGAYHCSIHPSMVGRLVIQ